MSGDVQPRKRKDKKKKKDDLGVEEPRGTAAALGEGDVFMHSQHDHGTGGHWCAKIIFFSLLAVLITLIGLIILENRGLTELEANSVESQYSGILEGWIEDAPDDDHHDEHTLELKHPDGDAEDHHVKTDHDDEDEDQELDEDEDHKDDDHTESDEADDDEHDVGEEEEDDEHTESNEVDGDDENDDEDESDEENEEKDDDDDDEESEDEDEQDQNNENEDDNSEEILEDVNDEENKEQDDDDDDEGFEEEIERIEREVIDDEDSDEVTRKSSFEDEQEQDETKEVFQEADEDEDFLDADDDEPPVERITTPPAGKPFVEIEDEVIEKPIDTLAEEDAYEKRQEELRREESQASQMWLKLAVGGALLVATHVVLRRATAPSDGPEPEERVREESPTSSDRRMTLIPEEQTRAVQQTPQSAAPRQIIDEEVFKKPAPVVQAGPLLKPVIEPVKELKTFVKQEIPEDKSKNDKEKELYSDEEEVEEEEEEEEDIVPKKITPQQKTPAEQKQEDSEPEEVPDDVEIIDDEQIEEEEEEEDVEDEEEISDVDDTELLSRLEAKYGRLPEPERPGKYKEAGNSIEDEWPGEPSESYWREQLDIAEEELRQSAWASCGKRVAVPSLADSGRARWIAARAFDLAAEAKRDNQLLSKAITAYLHLLKMNERLPDKKLLEVANRAIDRINFRGTYLNAEPIYRLLIRRFPHDVGYRNNLTISFLMANRVELADEVLKETLQLWPNDRVALAHHGFVLKNHFKKLEEAVIYLQKALEGDAGSANEARFYYHLGDALLQLGRRDEADDVHKRGTALGHFLSPAQRSLYNVPRLRSRPWWPVEETPYVKLARALEKSWRDVLREGSAAQALYEQEKEGLRERGSWSQLDVFVRGRALAGRCERAPVTCALVRAEAAAAGCRRGQVKFSAMAAGTHVRAHVGPTNCRLRMHLALSNTDRTYIRVHNETRQWELGKTFIFDDSFEHEVWHNGTDTRLVLIVDVWHPDLTPAERQQLPAI